MRKLRVNLDITGIVYADNLSNEDYITGKTRSNCGRIR